MSDEFQIMVFPENIRNRPGQFLGDTSTSSPLLKELVDNALDEFQKGLANYVYIKQNDPKHGHIVADNSSRGFSIDEAFLSGGETTGKTIMDAAVSYMSAGTKFNKTQAMAGMNGTGTKCVTALSDDFIMVSNLGNRPDYTPKLPQHLQGKLNGEKYYFIRYKKGYKVDEGFTNDLKQFGLHHLRKYSTIAKFIPDLSIIGSADAEVPQSLDYIMKYAELNKRKLIVTLNDEEYKPQLADYKYSFNVTIPGVPNSKNPQIQFLGNFELSDDIFQSTSIGSANGTITPYGKHIELFKQEYRNAFRECFGYDAEGLETSGLNCFVFLVANEVDYSAQNKSNLSRIPDFNFDNMYHLKNALKKIMKANEEEFRTQYDKLVNFKLKKGDLNKKQKINTLLGQDIQSDSVRNARRAASYLPSKLLDAYSSNRNDCELFIVEGNSAMSDFQKYRDAKIHAVIPLRGVPLNACHHDIDKVLEVSQEFRDMMKGIGSGVDENYNIKKLRYGKIIVSADADADGNRICAMILGFFGSHCKYLIDNGNIYVAVTPFYIQEGNLFYNGEHGKLNNKKPFKRIKGLGSLGKDFPNALLNQKTRRLIKITSENVNEAIAVLTNAGRRKELLLESGALKEEVYK